MKAYIGRRGAIALLVAAALFVVAGGIAWAAIPGPGGVIQGCYDSGGNLKIVNALPCPKNFTSLPWQQSVRAYRVLRATPDEVEVTVVGTGPLGFPEENGTHILEMELPQGVYVVDASIAARKGFGSGDFLCYVHDNAVARIFTRTSLGDAPGHIKRNTVSGSGIYSIPAGGGKLILECWQAQIPELPGSPSGDNPTVFWATLQATSASQATLVRYPAGTTVQLP